MNKKVMLVLGFVLISGSTTAVADHVNGYTKKDGTYVQPYERSHANSTQKDNYSYDGNTNPYTGKTGHNREYDAYGNEKK